MFVSRSSILRTLAAGAVVSAMLAWPLIGHATQGSTHGAAQGAAQAKPAAAQAASASKRQSPLDLEVDKGASLTLKTPAASVFVANPEVADVQVLSPTSIMVYGKKTGETTLMVTGNEGETLINRTVLVRQNLANLRAALRVVVPDSHINAEPVPNGIVITGDAKDASAVEDARKLALRYVPKDGEVINRVKVRGSNQIHIRVRFAEVSRDVDKRFGIDWESIGNVGGFAFGLMSGDASSVVSSGSNLLNVNRPTMGSNTNDIISFSKSGGSYNVNGLIDALASEGFVTILAEPSLTAMSGETASFLAGGEFPIPVPQSADTITIEWKTFGVSLAFTPTLVGNNRINMHVRPEVSQLSDVGAITLSSVTVPALTTRRAETTIELGSGQSFAIGGLLNNNQTQSVNKYPFLGDMPIIGQLFRSTRFQNNQSELVIIITPYVVSPTPPSKLALPTDGFSAPSDIDQIFLNRTTNSDPAARTVSGEPAAIRAQDEAPMPAASPVEPVQALPSSVKGDLEPLAPAPSIAPKAALAPVASTPTAAMPSSSSSTVSSSTVSNLTTSSLSSTPADSAKAPTPAVALPTPEAAIQIPTAQEVKPKTLSGVSANGPVSTIHPVGPGGFIVE